MNINRDYLIINDVKKSNVKLDNGSIFFYITDKNTQNIFVNLVINVSKNDLIQKYANIENAEDYTLTMNIVKPDNTYKVVEGKLHDKEKAIFEFNLNEDCCDEIGTYRCELLTKCNINGHEEITTSNKLTYKVKSSVLNDLDNIVEAPEYPLVIQLFDKLSDIEQYEEDRRANELARQLAEQQRQTRFNTLDADMVDRVNAMDSKMDDIEARISAKEQAVDKLIVDTKVDIDDYKVAKDTEIDEYKTAKDQQIDQAITNQNNKIDDAIANQNNKIDTAVAEQNNRITTVETNDNTQNTRLDELEAKEVAHESSITNIEAKNVEQDNRLDSIENINQQQAGRLDSIEAISTTQNNRLDSIEAVNVSQGTRLDAIEIKNQQQDDRLLDIEKVNNRQDIDIKCLYGASQTIDVTKEGNSIYLQNSNNGFAIIDEIKGNTLVNYNKEPNKEIILNGNINTQGYSNVTLTEGVDGGLVDVALEGNTMVNVCDQKDPVAITKSYTVETGNHVALQGEYDGKCRPVVTGNTLWIDNATEDVLTAFDNTKNLRLQSSFEDKVVTQEMVDTGEELAENLGKYRVDYKVTGKNKANAHNISLTPWSGEKINHKICDFKLQKGKQYTFTAIALSTAEGTTGRANIQYYKDGVERSFQIYIMGDTNPNSITFIYEGDSENCYLSCYDADSRKVNIQIEEGDTATSYEPYKEYTKTLYLNSPLLEGDTIEQQGNNVVHVHRSELRAYETDDELTLPTDMTNTLVAKATPQYEVISQSDTILTDSYVAGHLDFDTAVPVEKVKFERAKAPVRYVYYSTNYNLQFESDNVGKLTTYFSGTNNNAYTIDVVKGINKITIITKSQDVCTMGNSIQLDGIGFNASNIVVTEATDQDFGYFEGMKSVGECEELEVVSCNKNLYSLTENNWIDYGYFKPDGTLAVWKGYYYTPDYIDISALRGKRVYIQLTGGEYTKVVMYDKNKNLIKFQGTAGSSDIVIDFPENGYYIRLSTGKTGYKSDGNIICEEGDRTYIPHAHNTQTLTHEPLRAVGEIKDKYVLIDGKWYIERNCGVRAYQEGDIDNYITDKINTVYPLPTPTYELIDYNPFTVYSDTTHISNNSTIPCNMTIKNTGYNCLLKPNTTYTVSSNLGLNVVTTPSTLTEDCLRFYDTDTSTITTMKNVTILEGDYTTGKPLPSHFSGIESAFEQEYDEEKGKYKVKIRVQNEDASKENYIEFYIGEPLRGIGDVKDKVYVKNDKVVVERNCGSVTFDGSEDESWSYPEIRYDGYCFIHNIENIKNYKGVNSLKQGILNNFKLRVLEPFGAFFQYNYGNNIALQLPLALGGNSPSYIKQWLQQNPTTVVYQLAEPTYEEVEYNDVKLFIESFKNSTLFYNSNIPVTSKLWYSYSVPIVDTVAQTANVTDQQDQLIIDMAVQVSVLEMMTL